MLVTFKSKAAAEVVMYEEHAKPLLDLIHKDIKRGVITAAETANAIARLEAAVNESKARPTAEEAAHGGAPRPGDTDDEHGHGPSHFVSFATRAYPFLEMLRAAHRGGNDILWGV
jgi:hypothetical protein